MGWCAVEALPQGLARLVFGCPSKASAFRELMAPLAVASDGGNSLLARTVPGEDTGSHAAKGPGDGAAPNYLADAIVRLQWYFAADPRTTRNAGALQKIPIVVGPKTEFQEAVIRETRAIPLGETLSYAELAVKAGRSGAARAVGTVMSTNRLPILIPCHRVLGSNGHLGGYSAIGGLATKQKLLEMERTIMTPCEAV